MVVVRIELWPRGNRSEAKLLGEMRISNKSIVGIKNEYWVIGEEAQNPVAGLPEQSHVSVIRDHDRRQSVYALVAKAAQSLADYFNSRRKT